MYAHRTHQYHDAQTSWNLHGRQMTRGTSAMLLHEGRVWGLVSSWLQMICEFKSWLCSTGSIPLCSGKVDEYSLLLAVGQSQVKLRLSPRDA